MILLSSGAFQLFGGLLLGILLSGKLKDWTKVLRSLVCTVYVRDSRMSQLSLVVNQSSSLIKQTEICALTALAEAERFHEMADILIKEHKVKDSGQALATRLPSLIRVGTPNAFAMSSNRFRRHVCNQNMCTRNFAFSKHCMENRQWWMTYGSSTNLVSPSSHPKKLFKCCSTSGLQCTGDRSLVMVQL